MLHSDNSAFCEGDAITFQFTRVLMITISSVASFGLIAASHLDKFTSLLAICERDIVNDVWRCQLIVVSYNSAGDKVLQFSLQDYSALCQGDSDVFLDLDANSRLIVVLV